MISLHTINYLLTLGNYSHMPIHYSQLGTLHFIVFPLTSMILSVDAWLCIYIMKHSNYINVGRIASIASVKINEGNPLSVYSRICKRRGKLTLICAL